MGHYASECPDKKSKDSSGGSSGGFAMMFFKINQTPVEGDLEQISAQHTEQPNLKVESEEKNFQVHSEPQLEQNGHG